MIYANHLYVYICSNNESGQCNGSTDSDVEECNKSESVKEVVCYCCTWKKGERETNLDIHSQYTIEMYASSIFINDRYGQAIRSGPFFVIPVYHG